MKITAMENIKSKSTTMSSAEKALKILMAFVPFNHEMGTLELSKKLDIHKSTVSRLLHLLVAHDFLKQNPDTKKYYLGRSATEIGNAATKSLNNSLVTIAQTYLNELCEIVGESVALEMLSGSSIVLACHVEGQKPIRFSFQPGERVPINVAAGAKAILAYSNPELIDLCLKEKFNRFTSKTIMSKREYRSMLSEVQKKGVAYDTGERYEDVRAIAAPIFNHEQMPVAAVVIAGPAFRLTDPFFKNAVGPLKKAATNISQRLFY
jgi:DNA-binding IclR family transcriptional regulator